MKLLRLHAFAFIGLALLASCQNQHVAGPRATFHPPRMDSLGDTDPNAELHVYFGNLHSHTSYSDGTGKPAQAFTHARNIARNDFLAITEHNHSQAAGTDHISIATNTALYNGGAGTPSLMEAARLANQTPGFVALYGQEVSTISSGNHVNVFEVGEVINANQVHNGNFRELIDWLKVREDSQHENPVVQFNHPGLNRDAPEKDFGRDDFPSEDAWRKAWEPYARTIAVVSGPSTTKVPVNSPKENYFDEYLEYLALGFHLAPVADQDNHFETWGDATPARTGIIAERLNRATVLDALRQRHVFASEDKNLAVVIWVNGHLLGDRLDMPASHSLNIQISIDDPDEPNARYTVDVFRGTRGEKARAIASKTNFPATGTLEQRAPLAGITVDNARQYFFFRISQFKEDEEHPKPDRVWTAPIWFDKGMD